MIVRSAEFSTSAAAVSQCPDVLGPEIAFVGRSNVGKSSLINRLANRRKLARTSSEPGKTRTLNFYRFNDGFYLVDLPGYGYARVAKTVKEGWGPLIEGYLERRESLRLAIHVLDIRHAPSREDRLMRDWLFHHGIPYVGVATKTDKIKKGDLQGRLRNIREVLGLSPETDLIPFSAQTSAGADAVWRAIETFAGLSPESD